MDRAALSLPDEAAVQVPAAADVDAEAGSADGDRRARGGREPAVPRPTAPMGPLRWALLCGAILACAGYVLWRISDAYRFYQDDLLQFGVAQQSGLSWDLLSLNVFQHFAPANRLAHLFIVRVAGFSLTAGAVMSAVLVLLLLATQLWLLHEVGARFAARLLSVVAVGLSITVLDTAVWADASLHILPALVATNVVVAAHVRGLTTGRWWWHVVSVGAVAAGVLTQERVLFALPLVVLVDWLVLGAGRPAGERWRLLRSVLIPVAAMTVVALAAAAYIYANYVAGTAVVRPSLATTARTALGALTQGLVPPWVGVRLDQLAPLPVQVAIVAGFLLVAGLLVRRRRSNANALALLAAAFLLYFGFLAFSPILQGSFVDATALRLHNAAYLLTPTMLALSQLRFRRTDDAPDARPGLFGGRTWPAVLVAAGLAGLLIVMGGRYTQAAWGDERVAHGYLSEVARTEATWSRPDVTLLPLLAPPTVGRDWAEFYARHEFFLRFLRPGWVTQQLGNEPMVLDAGGRPRPVALVSEAALAPTGESTCAGPARTMLESGTEVTGEPLFLRLTYRTDTEVEITVTSTGGLTADAAPFGNWAVPLIPGEHTVVVPLHSSQLSSLLVDWSEPGAQNCVLAADIVRPVFTDDGSCRAMDRYGAPTAVTPCPTRRAG